MAIPASQRDALTKSGYTLAADRFDDYEAPKAATPVTENKARTPAAENMAQNLDSMTKDELAALAEERGVSVQGSGANGNVLKSDYLDALS